MKKNKVLIVDDEPRLLKLVKINLQASGYETDEANNGQQAIDKIGQSAYDLIILDIMLYGELDGFEVCRKIREFSDVPVIMLTSRARGEDRIQGFDVGADDYLTKPFSADELVRRVRAILRRSGGSKTAELSSEQSYRSNELVINFAQRRVFVRGKEVRLTATEYRILYEFARNAGKVLLHEEILTRVWGADYRDEVQYLRGYIRSLRKKIEKDPTEPRILIGKHGIGYWLVNEN